jgi:arsenate reductase
VEQASVLFICVHNAARSQMAEAFLRQLGGDRFKVESAGFEPTAINPYVIEVMAEEGVDLSRKKTQRVFDLYKQGRNFDYVITVCDETHDAQCPVFPGMTHRLHLPFPDPNTFAGDREEVLSDVRQVRDRIKKRIREFIAWIDAGEKTPLTGMWTFKDTPAGSDP